MNTSTMFSPCRNAYLYSCVIRHYAVKAASPAIAGLGKKTKGKSVETSKTEMEVEKDPHKLVNYLCGSNLMLTGEDIPLKPDSEYPDWLWNINTGPNKRLTDLEPGSKEYLELLKKLNIMKVNKLRALSKIKPQ